MARVVVAAFLAAIVVLGTTVYASSPSTDKLVTALKKKKMATVIEQLSIKGIDVNMPDSSKRLPLVEAVRSRDQRAVQALLEQGALAKAHEPSSGVTPLHVAFQSNLALIARNLLAHGADPNATDKAGIAARATSKNAEIAELVALYDAKGPLAFEAAPGTWLKEEKNGETYYWSPSTGESRWTPPPSCAWQRITVQGHPIKYINSVTGQEVISTPPALAWTKVHEADSGKELWLNWATNVSAATTPAELPADMVEALGSAANKRWYHPATGQYSYTDPAYSTAWRELKDEATGQPYWFNIESGESLWEEPEELAWERVEDAEAGTSFFHNKRSGAVSWEHPTTGPLAFVPAKEL